MRSFEDAKQVARKQLEREKHEATITQREQQALLNSQLSKASRVRELVPEIENEAQLIAGAMKHVSNAKVYKAVPKAVVFSKAYKKYPRTDMAGNRPMQWRINSADRRRVEILKRNHFGAWDLGTAWEYREPDEPFDTDRQHYFLSDDGKVVYNTYFKADGAQDENSFIFVNEFDTQYYSDYQNEERLNTLRVGLARLVVQHDLRIDS